MKIKFQHIGYMLFGLGAWLTSACSEQVDVIPDNDDNSTGVIAISVKGNTRISSRSEVVDPDDNLRGKQHVTRVQLYIYEADGDDYTFITSEDVNWKFWDGAMGGLETKQMYYTTQYTNFEDDKNYLFFAVGFDDTYKESGTDTEFENANSVAAYGAPNSLVSDNQKFSKGMFSLKGNDVSLISRSELFSGAQVFKGKQLKNFEASSTPIDLYRRVAGVIGYFKNLPTTYNGKKVDKICLQTIKPQNTQTHFLPKLPDGYTTPQSVPDDKYVDYITSSFAGTEGEILASINASDLKEKEITLSSYLLPMAASDVSGKSTLALALYDEKGDFMGAAMILYKPSDTSSSRSGTGIIDIPSGGDSPLMHYPIRANNFYRMGSKANPVDLSGGTSYIFIEIDPIWDEYYGGSLDHDGVPGLGIDNSWGSHDGGNLQ